MDKTQFTLEQANAKPYLHSQTQDVILRSVQDTLDIFAQSYEHNTQRYLFHEHNFAPEFYDLKTGLAGAILQKFSNYFVKAAILGTFVSVKSPRFREFMYESNKGNQLRFATKAEDAISWLGK